MESLRFLWHLNPTATRHLFEHICAETPVSYGRCLPGDWFCHHSYQGNDEYDWLQFHYFLILYAVEDSTEYTTHVNHRMVKS